MSGQFPEIIHQIWFGGMPSEEQLNYMIASKKNNPGYQYKLWTSRKTLDEDAYASLQKFCDDNEIDLVDIDNDGIQAKLINNDLIKELLTIGCRKERNDGRFWVSASDLLRVAVLYLDGGFYFDMGVKVCKSLSDVPDDHPFLIAAGNEPHMMASVAKCQLLKKLREKQHKNIEVYKTGKYTAFCGAPTQTYFDYWVTKSGYYVTWVLTAVPHFLEKEDSPKYGVFNNSWCEDHTKKHKKLLRDQVAEIMTMPAKA